MALSYQQQTVPREPVEAVAYGPCDAFADHGNAAAAADLEACAAGGAAPGMPGSVGEAQRRHARNLGFVKSVLELAMARDRSGEAQPTEADLAKNAAEWILADEVDVYVLSPTHDGPERGAAPGEAAYFDRGVGWRAPPANAPVDASDTDGVVVESTSTRGALEGDELVLLDPLASTAAELESVVAHEVLHDADEHDGEGALGRPERVDGEVESCPARVFDLYRSEFAAYWVADGGTDLGSADDRSVTDVEIAATPVASGSVRTRTATTAFSNRRQQGIFLHLCGPLRADGMWRVGHDWASAYAYFPYYYVLDPAFRALVDGLATPASANGIGSVRVEAVREAVATGADWRPAAAALDAQDRAWLAGPGAQPFWDLAAGHLDAAGLAELRAAAG